MQDAAALAAEEEARYAAEAEALREAGRVAEAARVAEGERERSAVDAARAREMASRGGGRGRGAIGRGGTGRGCGEPCNSLVTENDLI